jgi:hypothetical protein
MCNVFAPIVIKIIIKCPCLFFIPVFVGKLISRGLLFLRHRAAQTAAAAASTGSLPVYTALLPGKKYLILVFGHLYIAKQPLSGR